MSKIAGTGFEPASQRYERRKEPLLYPAIVCVLLSRAHRTEKEEVIKTTNKHLSLTRTGLEPIFPAWKAGYLCQLVERAEMRLNIDNTQHSRQYKWVLLLFKEFEQVFLPQYLFLFL